MTDQQTDTHSLNYSQLDASIQALALLESGFEISRKIISDMVEQSFHAGSITEGQKRRLAQALLAMNASQSGRAG